MNRIIVAMFVGWGIVSCASQNDRQQQPYEFYYYPKTNMYYNVKDETYFFSVDGAQSWDSLSAENGQTPATLGYRETLYSRHPDVWRDNEMHRKEYGGLLVNLVNEDQADTGKTVSEVKERTVKTTKNTNQVSTKQEEQVRKKGGLKKFINKIFGKKKKD